MRTAAIAAAMLAAAALAAAEPAFDAERKALAEVLRAKNVEPAALARCEALVGLAADDAQRAAALGMLAAACAKAGEQSRAAEAFDRLAAVERSRPGDDRAQRVWNARNGQLRALAAAKPLPGTALAAAAQRAFAEVDPAPTPTQRLEAAIQAARGLAADDQPAAAAWLRAQAEACDDAWLRAELRLQAAEAAQRAGDDAAALALRTALADDAAVAPQQRAAALRAIAGALDRARRQREAAAGLPRLLQAWEQAVQAGWKPDWGALDGLRWAAQLARRTGDLATAEAAASQLAAIAPDAGWKATAGNELAAVRCAQRRWDEAEALYAGLAGDADPRRAGEARLALAFVVYRDRGDAARGLPLVEAALAEAATPFPARAAAATAEARRLLEAGDRAGAAVWFARIEGLPGPDPERAKAWSQALVALGEIAESRADAAAAQGFYARALAMPDGDAGARVRARNAIEDIRYFE